MRKLRLLGAAIVLLSLLGGCVTKPEAKIVVAGSTSVQPFAEILAEAYFHEHPNIEIDVQGGGSSAGIMAVKTKTADIGMSSRELKKDEIFWSVEIAKDGLALIVHPDNPVSNLSSQQVQDIYSRKITNWKQVGGKDSPIHIITREEGSGTRTAFEDLIMGKDSEISPRAIVQDSNGTVRQLVAGDRNAIGFISLGLVDKTVKALALDGVAATKENVINLTYKLHRPFLFICLDEPDQAIKDFIDFVLSKTGQDILSREGLIPE